MESTEKLDTLDQEINKWFTEIDEARKRDESYLKHGERILDIYSCKDDQRVPFNILFSNTDTLIPALYSATPRPSIKPRFNQDDPVTQAASVAANRMCEYLIDTNIDGYESFNDAMKSAVIDSLLPGRGVTCVKYDAKITGAYSEKTEERQNSYSGQEALPKKEGELICFESKQWDSVLFGFARKWSKVPWIAFEEHIDKKEAVRLFGKETANKMKFLKNNDKPDNNEELDDDNEKQGYRKTATIYQIWDKDGGKKVRYISKAYEDDYLKVEDDPLELTGFYPIPRPMMFVAKSNEITATAPYLLYQNQAKELNILTERINKIVDALRVRGIYDVELGDDIANLLDDDCDNTLRPATKSASIAAEKGLQNAIWFMPVEQLVKVLAQLYQARESCKQVIYEVTGISDIIRGSSVASETATAQSIKSQWGTMRLKRNQEEVARYARDLLRMMIEMAATSFSEQTWANMTGLPYATKEHVMQAQQIMSMYNQYSQMQPQDGQQQVPPQYQQIIDQAQQILASPKWEEVLNILSNDLERSYKVDIETNSTIMPEATEDRQNAAEAMAAISDYSSKLLPLVQQGMMDFNIYKSILAQIIRLYPFGDDIDQFLKQMQPPAPPPQPQDNTMQVKGMELQAKQQSDQLTQQLEQAKLQAQQFIEGQKAEFNRIIEQGKASTQIHIAEMQIESNEKLAEYKAQLDANVKLEIARMNNEFEEKKVAAENEVKLAIANMTSMASMGDKDEELNGEDSPEDDKLEENKAKEDQFNMLMEAINRPYSVKMPDGSVVEIT